MTRHLPDLDALRLLIAVAHHGSIGGAARAMEVSQQAASERLRSVEAQVGVPLLRRGTRGSELTEAGVVVVEWARQLTDLADQVETAIEGLRADRGRELTVWASMTVAETLLPRWLVLLRQRQVDEGAPPTSVMFTATNSTAVVEAVESGVAQLGFVEGTDVPATLRAREVATDELVLVVAPGTALARRRRPLSPAEVAELPMTARESGSGTRQVLEEALARHGLTASTPQVELTTSTAIREAVAFGAAPAFLSRRSVARDLADGRLRLVPTLDLHLVRPLRAIWSGSAQPPAGPVRELVSLAAADDG